MSNNFIEKYVSFPLRIFTTITISAASTLPSLLKSRMKFFFVYLSATCHQSLEKSLNKREARWWQMGGRWQQKRDFELSQGIFNIISLNFWANFSISADWRQRLFPIGVYIVFSEGNHCFLWGKPSVSLRENTENDRLLLWPKAICCHLPPICHHPKTPLNTGVPRGWWQVVDKYTKNKFMCVKAFIQIG